MTLSRRRFIAAAASTAASVSFPAAAPAMRKTKPSNPSLVLNDASRLNPTPVARNVILRVNDDAQLIEDLRALLKDAAAENRPVCVGGARHSMGGQSLAREGFAATISPPICQPDSAKRMYRARSGARWRDVIAALDPLGFSVAVMQSNHDFSVGGTLSVNAHGWPVPFGPFGRTVHSFRLMLADGSVVTCSPQENTELFSLAIGGYGLFGIVIDADIGMVDNELLTPAHETLATSDFSARFLAVATQPAVKMAYGRLSVAYDRFLEQSMLITYRSSQTGPAALPSAQTSPVFNALSRKVFRAQTGSETGKKFRWYVETGPAQHMAKASTRNALLNDPVSALDDGNRKRTDILHEYFVPPDRFADFIAACRDVIPASSQDLLNVTLRYVATDTVSVLAFAPAPRIAAVMLFTQTMTPAAEADMSIMTKRLIDRVLALGGSFYLPYRLHARPDQVRAAYPRLDELVARKREYDPQTRFRNTMWDRYFAGV